MLLGEAAKQFLQSTALALGRRMDSSPQTPDPTGRTHSLLLGVYLASGVKRFC